MHNGTSGADWPLVGRSEELDLLRRLRSRGRGTSAFVCGPAGVGKSRLAREAVAQATREGWATLVIRGSAGFAGVPLGPFRTVFRLHSSSELTELTESVANELAAMKSAKGLLVWVDDCQDLDEASAALLHQVVAAGMIVAIITMRTGSHPPAALTELWKDGFAERIELQNLSRLETTELLVASLGGNMQHISANRIWKVTSGNPLYLREVVLSSEESGALAQVDGEWRWRGEWASGARLQEIVADRLGKVDPDELTALELLATAGSLPLGLVTGLATGRALQELETRGLVTTEWSGRRLEVELAHPLHAEVLRSRMAALQQRSIRHSLVGALVATGARRTADRVRLACWSLESGLEVDPVTLSLGTEASMYGIGHAISRRLREIMPNNADVITADSPAVPQDYEVAVRLARAAYEKSGGLLEGVTLASTLARTGATAGAEAILAELHLRADAIDDRIRVALGLSFVRFWGRYDVDQALAGLTEMAAEAEAGRCDKSLLAQIYQDLAGIAFNTAQPMAALTYARQAASAEGVELSQSVSAPVAAAALAFLGRTGEALALVDLALPADRENGHEMMLPQLLFARAGALVRMGELDQSRQIMEWMREVALSDGLLEATASVGVALGDILLRQGRPASAGRLFRDSAGLLAERDPLGYLPWALSGLARSRALSGEDGSAIAALDEARRVQPVSRHYDMCHYLAEIDLHRLAGRSEAAVDAARRGVAWAQASGMVPDEAQCLESWMRVAPSREIADRLAELASLTDSKLVAVLAEYSRALVASNPESLLEASEHFAEMSAWWSAAEAAGAAAEILDRRHETRPAAAAAASSAGFAERCEGKLAPATDLSSGPLRLTKREREVAILAAKGRSSREIAEAMYLSARTVENHLYRVYVKLGVTDRTGLAAALGTASSSE